MLKTDFFSEKMDCIEDAEGFQDLAADLLDELQTVTAAYARLGKATEGLILGVWGGDPRREADDPCVIEARAAAKAYNPDIQGVV